MWLHEIISYYNYGHLNKVGKHYGGWCIMWVMGHPQRQVLIICPLNGSCCSSYQDLYFILLYELHGKKISTKNSVILIKFCLIHPPNSHTNYVIANKQLWYGKIQEEKKLKYLYSRKDLINTLRGVVGLSHKDRQRKVFLYIKILTFFEFPTALFKQKRTFRHEEALQYLPGESFSFYAVRS